MTAAAGTELLSRFTASVREAASEIGTGTPVTAADIAQALLRRHPEYIDAQLDVAPGGAARDIVDWLWHCWSLSDPEKTGGMVDGRLLILALARIDEPLNAALRRGGRRRLEVERTFADSTWDWAQPPRVREFAEVERLDGGRGCALGADGARVVTWTDRDVLVFDTARGLGPFPLTPGSPPSFVACSPVSDRFAVAGESGVSVFDGAGVFDGEVPLSLTNDPARHVAFSPDGRLLAWAQADGLMVWTPENGDIARVPCDGAIASAFSHDGAFVAIATGDGVQVRDLAAGVEVVELRVPGVRRCAFTPDGRRLLTTTTGREAKLWELATRRGRELPEIAGDWALSPDGRLLADGNGGLDLAAATRRAGFTGERVAFSGDGRFVAAADGDSTRVYEILTGARDLPQVAPDTAEGEDLLGLEADANALADVIAAASTQPPLSIGLFGDWGSGKSFLIHLVQRRVRELSKRSARASEAAHCAHVRNVVFNAWHYADANLWASLATYILDELARDEDASTSTRLLEEIAKASSEREELARASAAADRAAARKELKRWTWGLVAPGQQETLGDVERGLRGAGDTAKLLLPTWRSRAVVALVPLAVVAIVLGVVGVDRAIQWAGAAAAAIAAIGGWIGIGAARVRQLLARAGAGTEVKDVRAANAKAELRAAEDRVARLQQELADLSSGRRLARYAAERSKAGDYRSQLGVVSRIHEDFKHMSEILAQPPGGDGDLPRIDRIVLYIDDLDRCPPRRVVEVLEAVHLILALPLFVVVLAVDPRWLLQSLELHYSQLLAEHEEERWKSSPLNYLEKIIQLPFTLRPMSPPGVAALVGGLLPVAERETPSPAVSGETPSGDVAAEAEPAPEPVRAAPPRAPAPLANINPRTLALTVEERDFATVVAGRLATPRAVKKLTNLYRLLRARLDEESGELDAFLDRGGPGVPEYEAVLILLAVLIAFPDTASEFLLSLGDLEPSAPPSELNWLDHVNAQPPELAAFLSAGAMFESTSTCEPFRRWALEVSRYSFETGQEVFAAHR
jgi:hypothetical protein